MFAMDIILSKNYIINFEKREYKILYCIGRGASAVAYMAECRNENIFSRCILKEYNPSNLKIIRNNDGFLYCDDNIEFENGMKRFILSGHKQNDVRSNKNMCNQTPPVTHIFEANGTAYIDVSCYDGNTLDKFTNLSLSEYTEILLAISKNISAYHSSDCLCLDLKPSNIFILQDSVGKAVTQLVEFIDFDSVRNVINENENYFAYTREWAAPEQTNPFSVEKICEASDIYTIGEIAFWIYFGRHSENSEHRGFSKYNFEKCKKEYRTAFSRIEIQKLLTKLFQNTLRPSVNNRFRSINEIILLFEKLVYEIEKKDFIIPVYPRVSPFFVGRENEIKNISENFAENNILWLYGTGGIGKSTLVKNYVHQKKTEYDVIIYLEFEGNIIKTFTNDKQLKISTLARKNDESANDYFYRKLEMLNLICKDKKVLLVIDNFEGLITKEFTELIEYEYQTVIVSRRRPPENSFPSAHISAISDKNELYKLISLNLGHTLNKNEKICFDKIIRFTEGHTLVLELIARQISAGNTDVQNALELIQQNGFSNFSNKKINNYKDGEEIYNTLSAIISALFSKGNMSDKCILYMKILSLIDYRGLERSIIQDIVKIDDDSILKKLAAEGWIYDNDIIRVHTVISETVMKWSWPDTEKDIDVMKYHKNVISVYEGMNESENIFKITKAAGEYYELHPRNIILAMYYDMLASFYDSVLDGAYESEEDDDLAIIKNLKNASYYAVEYAEKPENIEEEKLLCDYYLSLASVFIRTNSDENTIKICLERAADYLYTENMCSYYMVRAWYSTVFEQNINKTNEYIIKAKDIASQNYTDIEIIDIIYIPAANCYFTFQEYDSAIAELSRAADICRLHKDVLQYVDKLAELLNCLLDVYFEKCDDEKCRELICEIDDINNKFCEQGIFREINSFIRETLSE